MATKFYMHNATSTDTGTLPTGFGLVNGTASAVNVSGADTNRVADTTIGASQASGVLTTLANTSSQTSLIRRFLSAPLAAQTIAQQAVDSSAAWAESSLNSDFQPTAAVTLWRPGTGAVVGLVKSWSWGEPGTAEAWAVEASGGNSSAQTALDGDILVFEFYRGSGVQGMATAYTNSFFYDGTTEGSSTTAASFVTFPNTLTFYTPTLSPPPVGRNPRRSSLNRTRV